MSEQERDRLDVERLATAIFNVDLVDPVTFHVQTVQQEAARIAAEYAKRRATTVTVVKEPKGIGVQAFSPDIIEVPAGQWRFVRYEPCPMGRKRRHCKDENHHWGRGDHVVPVNPDWRIGDMA